MAKYQFKIELKPRKKGDEAPDEPTIAELAEAIETGVAAVYGDDFEVSAYDGERSDAD